MSYTTPLTPEARNTQTTHSQAPQQGQLSNQRTVSLVDPSKQGRRYDFCFLKHESILTDEHDLSVRVSLAWEGSGFGGVAELIYCLVRIFFGTLIVKSDPLPSQNPSSEPTQQVESIPVAVLEEESEEADSIPTSSPTPTLSAQKPAENETELKIKQLEAEKDRAWQQWNTEMTKYDGIVKQRQERKGACEERLENLMREHAQETKKSDIKLQRLISLTSEIGEAQNAINKIDEEQLRQVELDKIEKGEIKGAITQEGAGILDKAFSLIGKKTTFEEEKEQLKIQKNAAAAPRGIMRERLTEGQAKKQVALEQVRSELAVIESTIKSLNDQMTTLKKEISELPDKNRQDAQIPNGREKMYLAIETELEKLKKANAQA